MLDDAEWAQLAPMLIDMTTGLKRCRERGNTPVFEAMKRSYEEAALAKYFELTGFRETKVQALWHHYIANFGPPCRACGRLLRTSRARFCAECGAAV
jgi:hypothetical protein